MPTMGFSFSDTIAGYVTGFDWATDVFGVTTTDGRSFQVKLTPTTAGEVLRNLGEDFDDCTGELKDLLAPGRYLFAYGIFYPEDGKPFEAKHIVVLARSEREYRFEEPDWWIHQAQALADFYLRDEFGGGEIDYRKYRTDLTLYGVRTGDRQETDTVSRLVYGFASAYLMTGHDRYLEAAERGIQYLRDHFRASDPVTGVSYWYHAIDLAGGGERKILASDFGDDEAAIPAYEQIYALAGPAQTYRITGDPRIRADVDTTTAFLDRHFLDRDQGGYFSHIDPVTFDPRSARLGTNRARKNWNSVGDHVPVYLINLWLATADTRYAEMLERLADTIVQHFPDDERSPFVQERFHEDWQPDTRWGWQQNRAVVGHNLKIAWNLMRVHHLRPNDAYRQRATRIAAAMLPVGHDGQRGGWYDVVERLRGEGETAHRFVWHDRKAWWQQEQAILAYLILAGSLGGQEYLRHAREASAFYNAWFLDHDAGGVYAYVLASGMPYLLGTERTKGSHSMAGYHPLELAYLAAVYTNLLITKRPMDFFFKPSPGAFTDNVLRVQPDLLPPGTVCIDAVTINDRPHVDFDAEAMTVTLPVSSEPLRVRVRIAPIAGAERFDASLDMAGQVARITVRGDLDRSSVPLLTKLLAQVEARSARRVALLTQALDGICEEGIRAIILAQERMPGDVEIYVVGANPKVKDALTRDELSERLVLLDQYDPARIERL